MARVTVAPITTTIRGLSTEVAVGPAIYAAITAECVDRIEFSESYRSSPAVLHAVNTLAELTGGIQLSFHLGILGVVACGKR
jgi:hypothetical protein